MIVDRIEDYIREPREPVPELLRWAQTWLEGRTWESFRRNFVHRYEGQESGAVFRGSAKWYCRNALYHGLNGDPKEPMAPRAYQTFFLGDAVESMVVPLAILAGVPVKHPGADGRQFVCSMDVAPGERALGHVDMVIQYGDHLAPVECKSMSEFGWEKSKRQGVDDTFGYRGQIAFYLAAMDVPRGFFVGVNKSTGAMFEEEVVRDDEAVDAIKRAAAEALEAHRAGRPPPRPTWATAKRDGAHEDVEHVRCSYCPYVAVCWPGVVRETVMRRGKAVPVWRRPIAAGR